MANNKLIFYLIVLFVIYNLFLKKESFRFTTGQVNYGTIDIYAVDLTTTPIQRVIVSPDISSTPVRITSKTSSFTIENLSSNFNPRTLSVTCHSVSDWTSGKKIINNKFGDNIRLEYNPSLNRLELSGLTFANLGYNNKGCPVRPSSPVLVATLNLSWIN